MELREHNPHWTFTAYENGKPVAAHDLDSAEVAAAVRRAMTGEQPLAPQRASK